MEEAVSKGLPQAWNLTLSVGLRRTVNGILCSGMDGGGSVF